jgi:hypothetical protein
MIYEIAGLRIKIENRYPYTTRFCNAYLSEDQDTVADITASVTEEELAEEKSLTPQFSDGYIENICIYRSICNQMPLFKRMLLHAAVLEYNGKAYAFLGRSGTGKSTHTGLWLKNISGTRMLNGDKPILQCTENGFIVYGTPWNGKEGLGCKSQAPLCGLCFLEQAKVNEIRPLKKSEVSQRVFTQVLLSSEEESVVATLEMLDKMVENVPAYLLKCDISEEAVKTSFDVLTGLSYQEIKNDKE